MAKEHKYCKWIFAKWLITYATTNKKVYWLLWGGLLVLAICAWQFGFAGIF